MSTADSSKVFGMQNGATVSEDGWAGSNPQNPYSVGEAAGIAPAFVDAPISFGALSGATLVVRPPA